MGEEKAMKADCKTCNQLGSEFTIDTWDHPNKGGKCPLPNKFPKGVADFTVIHTASGVETVRKCPKCGTLYRYGVDIDNEVGDTHHHYSYTRISESEATQLPSAVDNEALLNATYGGRLEEVKKLLKNGADPNTKSKFGTTPIINAAYGPETKRAEVVRCLIEHGAKVNARDNQHNTALYHATLLGNTSTSQVLLDHGARVDAKTRKLMNERKSKD